MFWLLLRYFLNIFHWKYLNIKMLLILGQNKCVNNKIAIK